jgi:uncharacterized protein YycO
LNQHVLDPVNKSTAGKCPRPSRIPKAVENFGRIPDVNVWNPGDLILVSAVTPNFVQRAIQKFQRDEGYHEDDARWHHAAIYIGDSLICEATRAGVKGAEIFGYVGNYLIRVRRDKTLTLDQSWKIAINAMWRLK